MPKKLRVLMVVAILTVMAGACGSSENGDPSGQGPEPDGRTNAGAGSGGQVAAKPEKQTVVETVQVAYREMAAEQTAKTTFEMTMAGPSVDPDNSGQPAPMTMTLTGEGAVDFAGGASNLSMRMAGMGTMEVRQVGNVVYTKMLEEFAAQVPGGKPWVAMDAEEVYGQFGGGLGGMRGGVPSDPARQLEYLRGISDSVEKVGTDTVRGVPTTRYQATINAKKLVAELDGEARKKYEEAMRKARTEEIPVEIWLDDQNRVRRYAMGMKMDLPGDESGSSRGNGIRTQVLAEYYDFGTAVDVQAPPPNQTMDGSRLVSSQAPA